MKRITRIFILCAALALGGLLPATLQAGPKQGHHQAGLSGQVVGLPTFVTTCNVRIVSSDTGRYIADIAASPGVPFEVALKPGVYTLQVYPVVPLPNPALPPGTPLVVQVQKKQITELTLSYSPQPQ